MNFESPNLQQQMSVTISTDQSSNCLIEYMGHQNLDVYNRRIISTPFVISCTNLLYSHLELAKQVGVRENVEWKWRGRGEERRVGSNQEAATRRNQNCAMYPRWVWFSFILIVILVIWIGIWDGFSFWTCVEHAFNLVSAEDGWNSHKFLIIDIIKAAGSGKDP